MVLVRVNWLSSFPVFEKEDTVVLCGGLGTRLGSLTREIPKPLLPISGSPFLLHLLKKLQEQGLNRFYLAARYLNECFSDFVEQYSRLFECLELIVEPQTFGTGGALRNAALHIQSPFFWVVNGDSWIEQSLKPVAEFADKKKSCFAMVAVKSKNIVGGAGDKGGLQFSREKILEKFHGHHSEGEVWHNAGVYHVSREAILNWPLSKYDLESGLQNLMGGKPVHVFCSEGVLLDIGKPETFVQAEQFLTGRN